MSQSRQSGTGSTVVASIEGVVVAVTIQQFIQAFPFVGVITLMLVVGIKVPTKVLKVLLALMPVALASLSLWTLFSNIPSGIEPGPSWLLLISLMASVVIITLYFPRLIASLRSE